MATHLLNRTTIDTLAGIAVEAGHAIMQIYEQPEAWEVQVKGDASPLTQADLLANDIIVAALGRLAPEIPVLSEESPWTGGDVATYWAVDPLDGTKEFLKRNGEFTVNIGLVVSGAPVMGVVHAPAQPATWIGMTGHGAFVSRGTSDELGRWRPISASFAPQTSELRVVASRSHPSVELEEWLKSVSGKRKVRIVKCGSSLKICLLAEGKADLYPRFGPTCFWDTAAAHAVLKASGGKIESLGGLEMTYDSPSRPMNQFFLARAADVHI